MESHQLKSWALHPSVTESDLMDWLATALKDFTVCFAFGTWTVIGYGLASGTGHSRIVNAAASSRRAALASAVADVVDYRDKVASRLADEASHA